MTSEDFVQPARLLPVGQAAARLGIQRRQLYRLVEQGVLPRPVRMAGRNLWPTDAVERARQERQRYEPRNRRIARGPRVAVRLRRDRIALAHSFLRCWQRCSLHVALDVLHRHGAVQGPLDLGLEELARATAELESAVRLVRGLR